MAEFHVHVTVTASSALAPLHSCDSRYGQSGHKIIIVIIITIIVIVITILSHATDLFFLAVFLMNQRGCPPHRLKFQTALLSILCVSVSYTGVLISP